MATIITNNYNLPDAFVRAVAVDKHKTMGDISITQLIDAPQIRMLRRRNDIEEDAMDRMWALMGTAMHHVLERSEIDMYEARQLLGAVNTLMELGEEKAAKWIEALAKEKFPDAFDDNIMLETTLSITVDNMEISGTMDRFDKKLKRLSDYKNCSVWNYVYYESRKKWEAQQNCYAHMLRKHGYEVEESVIVAVFRDWSPYGKMRNKDYPPHPVMVIPIKLQEHDVMEKYFRARVKVHRAAEHDNIPDCTAKERWGVADRFAIMKKGAKRAVKIFDTEKQANSFLTSEGHKHEGAFVEVRPGEDKRCENYCPVRDICPQRKARIQAVAEASTGGPPS